VRRPIASRRALAKLLSAGELDGVWIPDERIRAMRRRLARRSQLVRARSRAKDEIHAVLMRCLKECPQARPFSFVNPDGLSAASS
jgi:transposase